MFVHSKSPFDYQGLSAQVKVGVTNQELAGANLYTNVGLRYARAINNKFAFELNFSALFGEDWWADDQSHYIGPADVANKDALLSKPRNATDFVATNTFADQIGASFDLDGDGTEETRINSTGIKEIDLLDYNTKAYKANIGLHYKITDNIEAIYDYKFQIADAILRHTTVYPLRGLTMQHHKAELKGDNFFLRGYYSYEDAGDS